MKKLVLMLTLLVSTFSIYAAESGNVSWFQGTFDDALAKGHEEGKLIFVDFYADWCGPCKKMKNEVFPKPAVYNFINNNYVAYKINIDHDSEKIAQRYDVRAIPTLLFLTEDFIERERLIGSRPADKFLEELQDIAVSHYGEEEVND